MPGEVAAWGSTGLAGAREGTTLDATHAASAFTPAAFMIFPADLTTVGAPPPNAFPDPLTVGFSSLAARIQPRATECRRGLSQHHSGPVCAPQLPFAPVADAQGRAVDSRRPKARHGTRLVTRDLLQLGKDEAVG